MKLKWNDEEVEHYFTLSELQKVSIQAKSRKTRIRFAILLKCLENDGVFPMSLFPIPEKIVAFVGNQLAIDSSFFVTYKRGSRSLARDRKRIREILGFREFHEQDWLWLKTDSLFDWLNHGDTIESIIAKINKRLYIAKIERPKPFRLIREAKSLLKQFERRFFKTISDLLSADAKKELDILILGFYQQTHQYAELSILAGLLMEPHTPKGRKG